MEDQIKKLALKTSMSEKNAKTLIEKSLKTSEIENLNSFDDWMTNRLIPNLVFIEKEDYAKMFYSALKIVSSTAATDYGSSRQRDFGQLWADIVRGYLGEIAFVKFAKKFNIVVNLGHERGTLQEYLPSDISSVEINNKTRDAKLKVSIKTTKFNGIWLDIPGAQFKHSDVYILVKIGIQRDHLFAYFKEMSVFKDKILKYGNELGVLTNDDCLTLLNEIPAFERIPAYICGYVQSNEYLNTTPKHKGKKGRKNYTISSWEGALSDTYLETIKKNENVTGKVSFEGIGSFSHDNGYVFSTDVFHFNLDSWKQFFSRI